MIRREQTLKEVGTLSKGAVSTPMMCGGLAGKPWSCDGEESFRKEAGIAEIWYVYEKDRKCLKRMKSCAECFAIIYLSTSDSPDISRRPTGGPGKSVFGAYLRSRPIALVSRRSD